MYTQEYVTHKKTTVPEKKCAVGGCIDIKEEKEEEGKADAYLIKVCAYKIN